MPSPTDRPLFHHGIAQLEEAFEDRGGDHDFLGVLRAELNCRTSDRAARLRERVDATLTASDAVPAPATAAVLAPLPGRIPDSSAPSSADGTHWAEAQNGGTADRELPMPTPDDTPMPPQTNEAVAVLGAWTALEVLNPQTFDRPEKLPGAATDGWVSLLGDRLAWEGMGERSRSKKKLFYHVVLGSLDAEKAFGALFARYTDLRAERLSVRDDCMAATVVLDQKGRLAGPTPVSVSSFAWGLPMALEGPLTQLADWASVVGKLEEELDARLRQRDADGNELPLDKSTLTAAHTWLVRRLRIPLEFSKPPQLAVRAFVNFKNPGAPDPLLLNSFYLRDLARAQQLFRAGSAGAALRLYVGKDRPAHRRDLLADRTALEEALSPIGMSAARWPANGRHPLVVLQQAAVNLALQDRCEPGVLAVNGPPGTGKTTLLRDVVAAVVCDRAEAMCAFDDPASAFTHAGEKIKAGAAWLHLYTLDASLRGHEILVASSNNKAVENVSAELPSASAVDASAGLSYFQPLSDALLKRPTWGLAAAVLGNQKNLQAFRNTFWWDPDVGLSNFLMEAAGTPKLIDGEDGKQRRPRMAEALNVPQGHAAALAGWSRARDRFRAALAKSQKAQMKLVELRQTLLALPGWGLAERAAAAALAESAAVLPSLRVTEDTLRASLGHTEAARARAIAARDHHDALKPGFWARLFGTQRARTWAAERTPLIAAADKAAAQHTAASEAVTRAQQAVHGAEATLRERTAQHAQAQTRSRQASAWVDEQRGRVGAHVVDEAFLHAAHDDLQRAVPWCDAVTHALRDDVFVAAMELHLAFIAAAAKPLRHNLGALMSSMTASGGPLSGPKAHLLPHAWSSLFLVVPVVSTTFASVDRMMGSMPCESLGWLLIDEAGQSVPQAAVGAVLRARRAVVVGDPVQVEPVVTLPERLTELVCRRFGVDPDIYNAPGASAQTLADAATPYFAEFETDRGSRSVGVPLLVHRRCSEPMFGIANAVAYQGLMVQAKAPRASVIRACLGPSSWIDVRGRALEKWCPEEGEAVVTLLRRLVAAGVPLNLYIVTPFNIVQQNLRRLVLDSGLLTAQVGSPSDWVSERIGTVHTVQGREAEAVIFVLGAPDAGQRGARVWGGARPNLLNVAVTRAQEAIYVVGNRELWREAGVFRELDAKLPL